MTMTSHAPPRPPPGRPSPDRAERGRAEDLTPARILLYVLLIIGLLAMIGPFLWMLLGSFKEQSEFLRTRRPGCPRARPWTTTSASSTGSTSLASSSTRSLVAGVVTAANLVFAPMLGYALAKLRFRGKGLLMALVLSTLMLPAARRSCRCSC